MSAVLPYVPMICLSCGNKWNQYRKENQQFVMYEDDKSVQRLNKGVAKSNPTGIKLECPKCNSNLIKF